MRPLRVRLTYGNVVATLALFLALGGAGYAATQLKKNSVKSKQIKDGAVATNDLKDGAVSSGKLADGSVNSGKLADGSVSSGKIAGGLDAGKLAPGSVTGVQVDEASLRGVDAARTGGMELKKIHFVVPFGTPIQSVLVFPGIFRIDAQCQNFGDVLDISAATGIENSTIDETTIDAGNASDTDAFRSIDSSNEDDLDTTDVFELDHFAEFGDSTRQTTVQFATPGGFAATVHLRVDPETDGCELTGTAIGG